MADQQTDKKEAKHRGKELGVAEALCDIAKAEWPKIQACVTLLLKLLRNVEREPDNTKFRRLNPRNATLSKDLFAIYGSEDFLHHLGFRKQCETAEGEERYFLLSDEHVASVPWAIGELQIFLEAQSDKQQRRERDARIAKENAAESQSRAWRPSRRALVLATDGTEPREGQAAEWNGLVLAPDVSGDQNEITFSIQMLTLVTDMKMSKQATLGDLRASIALKRACRPEQVKLALVSTTDGGSARLFGDHRSLEVCEVTDGCVICASFMNADEFQETVQKVEKTRESKSLASRQLDKLARETSWRFTQEVLAFAERSGVLDTATTKSLKRRMHTGELSMKEVRDQIIADAGTDAPFQEIIDKYLGESRFEGSVQRVSCMCSSIDSNRQYAQMIANENARGLIEASNRISGR